MTLGAVLLGAAIAFVGQRVERRHSTQARHHDLLLESARPLMDSWYELDDQLRAIVNKERTTHDCDLAGASIEVTKRLHDFSLLPLTPEAQKALESLRKNLQRLRATKGAPVPEAELPEFHRQLVGQVKLVRSEIRGMAP